MAAEARRAPRVVRDMKTCAVHPKLCSSGEAWLQAEPLVCKERETAMEISLQLDRHVAALSIVISKMADDIIDNSKIAGGAATAASEIWLTLMMIRDAVDGSSRLASALEAKLPYLGNDSLAGAA